jgi:hypothetical protein
MGKHIRQKICEGAGWLLLCASSTDEHGRRPELDFNEDPVNRRCLDERGHRPDNRRLRHTDHTATLACEDGNGKAVYRKAIEHTDFPLPEITLYFTNKLILAERELIRRAALCHYRFVIGPKRGLGLPCRIGLVIANLWRLAFC